MRFFTLHKDNTINIYSENNKNASVCVVRYLPQLHLLERYTYIYIYTILGFYRWEMVVFKELDIISSKRTQRISLISLDH